MIQALQTIRNSVILRKMNTAKQLSGSTQDRHLLESRQSNLAEAWSLTKPTYLALMRYCAKLMFAGDPVIVTCRSAEPSVALAILICAPDICLISFILLPCLPIMQPINWSGTKTEISATDTSKNHLTAICSIAKNMVMSSSVAKQKDFCSAVWKEWLVQSIGSMVICL